MNVSFKSFQTTLKLFLLIKCLIILNILNPNEAKCGKPGQSWDSNNLIAMNPIKSEYFENENVTYSCSGRMYVNDENRFERIIRGKRKITKEYVRFCQKNGQWNGAVPKCVNNVLSKPTVERIQVYDNSNLERVFDLDVKIKIKSAFNILNITERVFSSYPRGVSKHFRRDKPLNCLTSGLKRSQKWKFYVNSIDERIVMLDLLVRHDPVFITNSTFPVIITISKNNISEPTRFCRLYDIQEKQLSPKYNYTIETFINRFIDQNYINTSPNSPIKRNYLLELQFICEIKSEYLLKRDFLDDPYLSPMAKEIPGVITIEFNSTFNNQITICSHQFYQFSRRCGAPEQHLGTTIINYKKDRNNLVDYSVTLGCELGYNMVYNNKSIDKVEVRCNVDGDWIEDIPKCRLNNTSKNSENIQHLLAIIGVLAFMLIIGSSLLCICFYRIKKIKESTINKLKSSTKGHDSYRDSRYSSFPYLYDEFQSGNYDELKYENMNSTNVANKYIELYDDINFKQTDYMEMKPTTNNDSYNKILAQENTYV